MKLKKDAFRETLLRIRGQAYDASDKNETNSGGIARLILKMT
jgi:hypothetical protein